MMVRTFSAALVLVLSAWLCQPTQATPNRPHWSAGRGTLPLPPLSPAPLANQPKSNPTAPPYIGIIPTFITSTASERFLLVLRLENGEIVGVTRTEARHLSVLRAPSGATLRLDVIPLDGTGEPIVGIPVTVGVSVAVSVGAH